MRKPAPVIFVQSQSIGATYFMASGVIHVTSRAGEVLTGKELTCMIAHEQAHRQLFHCERAVALTAAAVFGVFYLLVYGERWDALLYALVMLCLVMLSRALAEFEADFWAMRRHGAKRLLSVFVKMGNVHPEILNDPMFWARVNVACWLQRRGA